MACVHSRILQRHTAWWSERKQTARCCCDPFPRFREKEHSGLKQKWGKFYMETTIPPITLSIMHRRSILREHCPLRHDTDIKIQRLHHHTSIVIWLTQRRHHLLLVLLLLLQILEWQVRWYQRAKRGNPLDRHPLNAHTKFLLHNYTISIYMKEVVQETAYSLILHQNRHYNEHVGQNEPHHQSPIGFLKCLGKSAYFKEKINRRREQRKIVGCELLETL